MYAEEKYDCLFPSGVKYDKRLLQNLQNRGIQVFTFTEVS